MDEKSFKAIIDSIAKLEKLIETNKENNAKVMLYLVNRSNEADDKIANLANSIDALNDSISRLENNDDVIKLQEKINKLETKLKEVEDINNKQKMDFDKALSKSKEASTQLLDKANEIQKYIDKNSIEQTKYIIIKRDELTNSKVQKLKDKIYKIFHYRKIQDEIRKAEIERQRQEEERKRIEEEKQLAEQQRIEEDKRKKEEEIRKILTGSKPKKK